MRMAIFLVQISEVWARFAGVLRPSAPGVKGSCGSEPSASEDGIGLVGAAIVRDRNQ